MISGLVMTGSYDYGLVALSVAIAVAASYAALDLAGRVTWAKGYPRILWLGGAISMGMGIWSMHYVGMLAFRLPVAEEYDWPTVLLSLVAAIVASGIGLFVASRAEMGLLRASAGSVFMGSGIAGMHYIGMQAMRLPAMCHYSSVLVGVSITWAMVTSLVALRLTFHFRDEKKSGRWRKALSATIMGAAIAGMHYTGMAAASFTASGAMEGDLGHALSISSLGTAVIVVATFMILGFTMLTSQLDRRLAAQAVQLESSEKRSRQILETCFDAFVSLTPEGTITDWNPEAERMFGWPRAAAMNRSVQETIIPPAYRACYEQNVGKLFDDMETESARSRRFKVTAVRRDLREFPVEITISATSCDETHYFAMFLRDLSQLKVAERKFRGLMESASEAIVLVDGEGRIVSMNSQAEKMFGYSEAELVNQAIEMLVPARFRGQYPEHRTQFFGAPKMLPMEAGEGLCGLRKDGSEFPVEISLSPLETEEGLLASALILDVSERKRAEQALRDAKEAAEIANAAKSSFLASMSHEIRTPMNGIIGMTELVLDSELNAEQREGLGLVKLSAECLLSIINDILDFSKIEAGRQEIEAIPFGLRDSLGETVKALSVRATQKGMELICDVDADVSDAVIGDPSRIRQVLLNLISNAIKFTERGEVVVSVREESHQDAAAMLHFMVRDTGIGIPAEKQARIFEAFSQADVAMARKYGGSGLGLTISSKLVGLMGGKLWVESQQGQGSTFHFTVRLGIQEKSAQESRSIDAERLRGLQALIVDDNVTNQGVLSGMLQRWGLRPKSVRSGREALQALEVAKSKGNGFDVILLDGQMPEMDGFTLAEQIKKDSGLEGVALMMLTSAGRLGDAARCRQLGISSYLVKPIRQAELLQAMREVLHLSGRKEAVLVTRHTLREASARWRVLVAEDNAVNQTLAKRILERRGFLVTVAEDGRKACEAFQRQQFDLVLMDVQMPEMDGYAATAAIREYERASGKRTPIVAMTANALKGDRERCLAAGMDGYVSKPIRTNELFKRIEELLERRAETEAASEVEIGQS